MSDYAIRCQGIGKRYRIGERERYRALRDTLAHALAAPVRAGCARSGRRAGAASAGDDARTFWALDDVSFDVRHGEVLGIIGRNGAGKSTLLKILSRITEPTAGEVDIYGRVGSLLEVGTGFHPELTGRENIFLNGAILGMGRGEIARKFDEIVTFAGVERFIDTPVKRYSSGMYMRLAFSIAAHLDPEILVVDEVLAVGDAQFQKKCLGKMEEIGAGGRTVLFVSHSMPNVLRLCSRAIILDGGRLVADGDPRQVTRRYLHSDAGSPAERVWPSAESAPGDEAVRLHAVRVRDADGVVAESIDIRRPMTLEVEYWNLMEGHRPTVSVWFTNEDGVCLFASNDFNNREWWEAPRRTGLVRATCHVPGNFFAEGQIFVLAAVCNYNPNVVRAIERDAVSFLVVDSTEGDGVRGEHVGPWPGVVRPLLRWEIRT